MTNRKGMPTLSSQMVTLPSQMVTLPKRPKSKHQLGPIEAAPPRYNSLLDDAMVLRLSRQHVHGVP